MLINILIFFLILLVIQFNVIVGYFAYHKWLQDQIVEEQKELKVPTLQDILSKL